MLTAEVVKEYFDYDQVTGFFTWKKRASTKVRIGARAGYKHVDGYVALMLFNKGYLAHRIAWLIMTGTWPVDQIDHIDGDRKNNKWSNLREANYNQNNWNSKKRKNNRSGYKGVYKQPTGWVAKLVVNRKPIYLGIFKNPEDAYKVYCDAAQKHHGEFARTA